MADVFNWIRPGYELVTAKLEWNVQAPFIQTTDGNGETLESPVFSSKTNPNSKWQLQVEDDETQINIYACHCDSIGEYVELLEPIMVKMSILDRNGRKVLHQMLPSTKSYYVKFELSKEVLIKSQCQQVDGNYTFCCKIFTHVKPVEPVSSADSSSLAIDCSSGLIAFLENLFDNMQFSDVNFNIGGREFPAHKNILAARSTYFEAMFKHPTKENLTNQIKIEDIEPEVFQELLRFIYTGRVPLEKLETIAAGLFITADKYLLDELKLKCENYLLHHMSPDNCVFLLLHGDLLNPAEPLKEAAKFFRRLPSQVMATENWAKMEEENPRLLCQIQKFLLSQK
jgi:speckle-type POZ protein